MPDIMPLILLPPSGAEIETGTETENREDLLTRLTRRDSHCTEKWINLHVIKEWDENTAEMSAENDKAVLAHNIFLIISVIGSLNCATRRSFSSSIGRPRPGP